MKASHLLLAGIGVGAALTYVLFYDPTMQSEATFDAAKSSPHPKGVIPIRAADQLTA